VLLAACGSSATVLSNVGGGADLPGRSATEAGSAGAPAEPGTIGGGGTAMGPDGAAAPAPDARSASQGFADDAKIVKTGTLTLEVAKLDDALSAARAAIAGLGGYVSGTNEANDGDRTQATIVYRIPAARWDEALQRLRGLASKVVGEQTEAVEVTGQVIDLEARIANLRATESALQGIMAKALKISDVLEVQSQLTAVQGEIEQLSAQKAHLEDQAALGTLSVSFAVTVPAVTVTREGWDPATEIDRALASLVAMLQGLASFGIWFAIVALPVVVALALVLAVALIVGRRLRIGRPRSDLLPPAAPPAGSPPAPATPDA
jgi:uncharacterized small protein (DUF1192 family)